MIKSIIVESTHEDAVLPITNPFGMWAVDSEIIFECTGMVIVKFNMGFNISLSPDSALMVDPIDDSPSYKGAFFATHSLDTDGLSVSIFGKRCFEEVDEPVTKVAIGRIVPAYLKSVRFVSTKGGMRLIGGDPTECKIE